MARSRNWHFTINNYHEDEDAELASWPCKYMIYGREVGEKCGTPHFQGFIVFKDAKSLGGVKKLHKTAHWEVMTGTVEQGIKYCSKGDAIIERGERPLSQKEKGDSSKRKYEEICNLAEIGELDKIKEEYPSEYIRHYSTLHQIHEDKKAKLELPLTKKKCGVWIYGPSNGGKSTLAQSVYSNHYVKDHDNNMWPHYKGEPVIIVDDVDPYAIKMTTQYKKWVNTLAFRANSKYVKESLIRPKLFIFTSNYSMDEIWGKDSVALECMRNRFEEFFYNWQTGDVGEVENYILDYMKE